MHIKFLILSWLAASSLACAQDVSLLAGSLDSHKAQERSFAAELGFSQRMNDFFSLSAEYYNEGHPRQHHRDGFTSQLWLHTPYPEHGASFGVAVGPYYYFDTTTGLGAASDYRNLHGWGKLFSASAKWHFKKRSYVEVRVNHVSTHGDGDSNSVLIGMGYELKNVPDRERLKTERPGDRLLMVQAGQAIVNSFESERAAAYGIEYRDTVTQNMEWSVTALNEGRVGLVQRKGVAGQIWLLRPFTDRTVLELGGGGYLMRDRINRNNANEASKTHLVPIVTIGMRYRINPDWRAQLSFSRVVTDYHRDSDILLVGIGRVF
ncbi:hypothetical protein [Massilia psychrophila]|jgi:hypothetical protein|uniref:Porin n=1 Tax=Massilia psychrophila TaxID=1603353 RepID=A0A2G8T408_9BURK|nr:hypothetical protein [Massilia psychrophila]PIL40729.1 hypothetical protein CR103_06035 [Massilia psychrophila]GGE64404.1 hypothetical protein GCM10008020_05780 [Massilia psychrophila]